MKKTHPNLFLIFLIIFSITFFGNIHAQNKIPEDFCINQDELKLYNLINKFRQDNDLPLIQLSKSLSYVAKLHVKDLYENHPDTSICNLHSWSNKGDWTACCHQQYIPKSECMWNKPKELSNYNGKGYELAFWESIKAEPDSIMYIWTTTYESKNMLLNTGKWEDKNWEAIGIGINNNYAVIWFGEKFDNEDEPLLCGNDSKIINQFQDEDRKNILITKKTGKFYLIFGSYNKLKDAKKEANKLINKGFPNTNILKSNNRFRIGLSSYKSFSAAQKAQSNLPDKYQNAWVLKY